MSGFEDSFNASGRRKGRNKKAITIAKKAAVASTPIGLTAQLADEATKGAISKQVKEGWSNIDGFDNASGKKFTSNQKIAAIIIATVVIVGGAVLIIKKLGKKKK